jgi:aspartate 1-decarboxylase
MLRTMCKGKIHRATVTGADLDYIGSITIFADEHDRITPGALRAVSS